MGKKCHECGSVIATKADIKRHPQNSCDCPKSCWCWTRCWDEDHREVPDPEVRSLRARVRAMRKALRARCNIGAKACGRMPGKCWIHDALRADDRARRGAK